MTTEKHNQEIEMANLKDRIISLEQWKTIAYNAENKIDKLEAKNASLALQNEALREAISTFNKFAGHRPTIDGKVEFFRYLSKSARERGQANADSEVWEEVANLVELAQQPTPDPDKISAVVKAAVQQRNLRQKIKDQAKVTVIFSKDKEGQAIVYPDDYFEACKKTEMLVDAFLNDTKGVG